MHTFAPSFMRRWIGALAMLGERPVAPTADYPLRPCPEQTSIPAALVVAASVEGASALEAFLAPIARRIEAPILIAQNLPGGSEAVFARRLELATSRRCRVAVDGDVLAPGAMLLSPGGACMRVARCPAGRMVHIDNAETGTGRRRCADALLESAALAFGPRLLAVVLAGPGEDGGEGACRVAEAGGRILVQDEASSVVWDMPGAVARAGHAEAVMPLRNLSQKTLRVMDGDDA